MAGDEENMLTEQLKRWGYYTVNRIALNDDGPSAGDSVLAKKRNEAPGTKENFERELVGRGGEERRRYMARKSGVPSMSIAPLWSCDPVPARNDAGIPRETGRALVELDIPEDLRWIDRALSEMARRHPLREKVVREHFCGVGSHEKKAAAVRSQYGGRLSVWQYRRELQRAYDWLLAKAA
jgi:hypothetical protein